MSDVNTNPNTHPNFTIRPATEADIPTILDLIRGIATYEKLLDQLQNTPERLKKTLFGHNPHAECYLGEAGNEAVGYLICFHTYSTFRGQYGIYIEDIYIRPEHRGRGYGKAFMQHVAKTALERNCGRIEWAVLDWNTPAIEFYEALGAKPLNEWITYRLEGDAITPVAQG